MPDFNSQPHYPKQGAYPSKPYYEEEKPINWRKYLFIFLTNWYWFLITIFIALSIAFFKNRYTLQQFKATATILIEEDQNQNDILGELRWVRFMRRQTDLANEVAKFQAFNLHYRTIDSLKWDIEWKGHGRLARIRPLYSNIPFTIEVDTSSSNWYKNQNFKLVLKENKNFHISDESELDTILPLNNWIDLKGWKFRITPTKFALGYTSYSFRILTKVEYARLYRQKFVVTADEEEGTIISVSTIGPIGEKEIDYINSLCDNYIQSGLERRRRIADNSLKFIEEQIIVLQDSLTLAEKQLLSYRVDHNVVDLSQEGQVAYRKLENFYKQKTELKLKQNYYSYLVDYISQKNDPQAIIAPTLVDATDQLLIDAVSNLQLLYETREDLEFSVSKNNPSLIRINERIQNSREKLIEILNGLIENNQLAIDQLNIQESAIKQQLLKLPVSEQELLSIQRKFEVNNTFYTYLLQKRAEAGIQKASTVSNVRILDPAAVYNLDPVGTKQTIIYILAFLLGLFIPGIVFALVEYFDNRIKDRQFIENNTDTPLLGVVSHHAEGVNIPVFEHPGSAFSESFRQIRTSLQMELIRAEGKVIMVTSTISGEGKTFIATNLATIFAMNNKKVLLMGLDLRKPTLHKIFDLKNHTGITSYLVDNLEINEIIKSSHIPNLDVLPSGPVPYNPAELLETQKMELLMKELTKRYEYIIMDTPPIALVTDAILISRYTQTNIYVIRQNYSHKNVLDILNQVLGSKIKNLNLIVNDIRIAKSFGYSYYYGYGYGYGYGNYSYKYGSDYYTEEK